jgi:hypothetical protein
MKKPILLLIPILLIFIAAFLFSCRHKPLHSPANGMAEYYENLFIRSDTGYTGGDGTYSTVLPDGRIAWVFGDTFIGGVAPGRTRQPRVPLYIRNSLVIQDGDSLRTLYHGTYEHPASFVIPEPESEGQQAIREDSVWFWPGDVYVENGEMVLFLSKFNQVDTGMWGFNWLGTYVARYSLPVIEELEIILIPYSLENHVHYGHAVCQAGGYTYVYGAREGKPHAARYRSGQIRGPWEFFDGREWCDDPSITSAMGDIDGSEQFSVFRLKDRYVLVTQMGGISPDICSFTSETPYGPWSNRQLLYSTPLPENNKNLFTYNALAHPHLLKDGEILISYNTNSMVLGDHFRDAYIYRPRFITVPVDKIFGKP